MNLRANIEKYDNNNLSVRISGITPEAKKEQVAYYYSYDKKKFQQIATGSLLEDWDTAYNTTFDVSDIWYGDKNLYLYVQDTKETFFAKLNFEREKLTFYITIEQPNSSLESSKTLRATYPDG